MNDFTKGYIECALWSMNDESGGVPLDDNYCIDDLDISTDCLKTMQEDCDRFQEETLQLRFQLGNAINPSVHGHDFWLTRNGHGAGFWGRGCGDIGDQLTDAAAAYGEVNLYVENGVVHDHGEGVGAFEPKFFVAMMANMQTCDECTNGDDYDDAAITLSRLVEEARKIQKVNTPRTDRMMNGHEKAQHDE